MVLDKSLYITAMSASGEVKMYRLNGQGWEACKGSLLAVDAPPVRANDFMSWSSLEKPTVFNGKLIYIGVNRRVNFNEKDISKAWPPYQTLGLFVAARSNPNDFVVEKTMTAENLTDIAIDHQRCYVVSYCWKDPTEPTQGAITTVSASTDLKTWSKLFSFQYDTFVSALEVNDGDFYLGLGGTRQFCTPSTGTILKVGKEKLK
jgi:hypothetical protein